MVYTAVAGMQQTMEALLSFQHPLPAEHNTTLVGWRSWWPFRTRQEENTHRPCDTATVASSTASEVQCRLLPIQQHEKEDLTATKEKVTDVRLDQQEFGSNYAPPLVDLVDTDSENEMVASVTRAAAAVE
eukprot:3719497-Amphidinium_carterae.1